MDFLAGGFAVVVKVALAGFVMWIGWLSFSTMLVELKPQSFERVASLVLLALLCTTLAGLS